MHNSAKRDMSTEVGWINLNLSLKTIHYRFSSPKPAKKPLVTRWCLDESDLITEEEEGEKEVDGEEERESKAFEDVKGLTESDTEINLTDKSIKTVENGSEFDAEFDRSQTFSQNRLKDLRKPKELLTELDSPSRDALLLQQKGLLDALIEIELEDDNDRSVLDTRIPRQAKHKSEFSVRKIDHLKHHNKHQYQTNFIWW